MPLFLYAHMLSCFSHVQLFVTLWTVAQQAPLSMGFSRQECWGGLPFPLLGHLYNPEIEPVSLISPALAATLFTISTTWKALFLWIAWNYIVISFPLCCCCCCILVSRFMLASENEPQDNSCLSFLVCIRVDSFMLSVCIKTLWWNCQHPLDHQKSKRVPEKHLFLLYWVCQSHWLCGSQ